MRKTQRLKRSMNKKSKKKQRGGTIMYKPPDKIPDWPEESGCKSKRADFVKLEKGTLLDRFGSVFGGFVAVLQKDEKGNPIPASFASRSLRTLGETPYYYKINGKTVDLRKIIYDLIYNPENDKNNDEYYVLEVIDEFEGKFPCKAASAFYYPGGALQLGLPGNVDTLIKDGKLRKLGPEETKKLFNGIRFPPYIRNTDGNEAAFRPLSESLYTLMDMYYSDPKNRADWRKSVGLDPDTPVKPAASIKTVATVIAKPHVGQLSLTEVKRLIDNTMSPTSAVSSVKSPGTSIGSSSSVATQLFFSPPPKNKPT